jgi:hypothetical protein
MILLVK